MIRRSPTYAEAIRRALLDVVQAADLPHQVHDLLDKGVDLREGTPGSVTTEARQGR